MMEFVDPRSNPEPPPRVSREPAAHGEELRELVKLSTVGHVYDVERWIQDGRPIQALTYKRPGKAAVVSPLRTAIRKKHRDLVLLFLCNGYRLELEPDDSESVLDEALRVRAFDILELLLKWGADPTAVRTESVIDTYTTDLIDRFWRAGVDYTADPGFVDYLARTVNKPLYGWLRRNGSSEQRLQNALDVALLEAVSEDKELPARLLLWAGADPHRKVPTVRDLDQPDAWDPDGLSSSAETAILYGRQRFFDLLRIEAMPELESQVARADDSSTLKRLVALRPPSDWSEVILTFIRRLCWRHSSSSWDSRDAFRFIESQGGRLTTVPPDQLPYLRRQLLDVPAADDFLWLVKWLKKAKNCEPAIYEELTRTRGVRRRMEAVTAGARYLTPSQKMSHANESRRRAAERKSKRTLTAVEGVGGAQKGKDGS